jgi:polysaccharide chain length determinant protein (PEP-CTERM system associated)
MAEPYEATLTDYWYVVKRRARLLIISFAGIFLVAVLVAYLMPPTYRSSGTILVESQQVPDDVIRSTVSSYVDERIAVIKQRVLTRTNLLKIVDKYGLFKDQSGMTGSALLDMMRQRVNVETIGAEVGKTGQKTTIAFTLSYDDKEPDMAFKVANDLVTLFLEENVKTRTERATETTDFLAEEAKKLKADLEDIETKMAEYKQRHGDALPDNLELRMSMATSLESEIKDVQRQIQDERNQLNMLDIELTSARSGLPVNGQSTPLTPAEQLAAAKIEYEKEIAVYKEAHPDIKALKRKIAALEKEVTAGAKGGKGDSSGGTSSEEQNLVIAKIQARIDGGQANLKSLTEQEGQLRAKLAAYQDDIIQTPQVERGLTDLKRDYENAKDKYDDIRSKQMNAQISENMEAQKMAERFSLIESPLRPDVPIAPKRGKLIAMGFFLAVAGAAGLVMLLEAIDQRVRGAGALEALVGQPLLVSIPYISTIEERSRKRAKPRLKILIFGTASLLLIVSLAIVHFFYKPLDILFYQVLGQFV